MKLKIYPSLRIAVFFSVFFSAFFFLGSTSFAQWSPVGSPGFSPGSTTYTSLAINPKDGIPYIAFADGTKSNRLTVMKYTGSGWSTIGETGFSTGSAYSITLSFNPKDGLPYVAFAERNSDDDFEGKVVRYTGSQWTSVGSTGFVSISISSFAFAIASDGTPYLVYGSYYYADGNLTAKKFDGVNWVLVGPSYFTSDQYVRGAQLAISQTNGTLYVLYESNKPNPTLLKFDTSWKYGECYLLNRDYSTRPSMILGSNDTLYAGYLTDNNRVRVARLLYNRRLITYGDTGFQARGFVASNYKSYVSAAFNSKDGFPYVAYIDSATGRAAVAKYTNTGWVRVGNAGFSAGSTNFTKLDISKDGTPYIGYTDEANGNRATVMKYMPPTLTTSRLYSNILCPDGSSLFAVDFTATGDYSRDNVFTAQLSDSTGSFVNPTTIGSIKIDRSSRINAQLPAGTPPGIRYRIRIVSNSPAVVSTDNGQDITINGLINYYEDKDRDGYGDPNSTPIRSCSPVAGHVPDSTDCNDNIASINPNTLWVLDADGDGYYVTGSERRQCTSPGAGYAVKVNQQAGDCDDSKASVNPGALEVCGNGIDDNCNGQVDEGCTKYVFYKDSDGDGYGGNTDSVTTSTNTAPPGYVNNKTDCDDSDKNVYRTGTFYGDGDGDGYTMGGAVSLCYGSSTPSGYAATRSAADDCNDSDRSVQQPKTYYVDSDGDGYGCNTQAPVQLCAATPPKGYSVNNTDCNDNNAAVNPGAKEVCGNGIDDNCNGQVDEGCALPCYTYYQDYDCDGYGNPKVSKTTTSATPPPGYVRDNTDCNDRDRSVHPGAKDIYDGKDNDCDGQTDEDFFQITITDAKMYEGNSNQCYMYFTVYLNWIPSRTITVNYSTQDGSATVANCDYVAKLGKVTFCPGSLVQFIAVPVNGDRIKEGDETFKVVLNSPYNASINKGTATGTILNDDKGGGSNSLIADDKLSSLSSQAAELSVKLSPVPARSNLTVSLTGFSGKTLMQIFDGSGRQVKQQNWNVSSSSLQQIFDVSSLAGGSYLIVVSDEKGNKKTEKFIVSR